MPNAACIVTLLDRLLHPADVTVIEGDSYRKRESEQETADRRRSKVTPSAELLQPDSNPALYVSAALSCYANLPDTPSRASASDQWLARRFHDDGVPLRVVETALLLGSLRRLIRPADAPRLSSIRSLAYFRLVVDKLRAHPAPEGYLDYLRLKLRQAATALPANVQKPTYHE